MTPNNTITVGELIELLKLQDPNDLIELSHMRQPNRLYDWDTIFLCTTQKDIISFHYKKGDIVKVEPEFTSRKIK